MTVFFFYFCTLSDLVWHNVCDWSADFHHLSLPKKCNYRTSITAMIEILCNWLKIISRQWLSEFKEVNSIMLLYVFGLFDQILTMARILTHLSRWYLSRCCMELFFHSLKIHLLPFCPRALDYHRTHASPGPEDNSAFLKPLKTALWSHLQLYHIPSDVASLSCYVKTQLFESLRSSLMGWFGSGM